ncbi:MTH1187 family thiamine-binding protein [Thiorhodococcus minor]|uniref:MTH1187 family thiamine-binding protein n=1 Tax=Thiorhodococcus minor TaxID=57489 RepID=A0A6M0JY85_9GAMM|nr:MTH1187 family thiamine-binding protein [Thiorhodococcus minor]NEV62129.1 MTH1187 family thiamine-binding protein [Thiorhodococcus minor]
MSVILDLAMFPTDQGVSVSRFVAPVVAMIRDSGLDYQLSPMGTQIETDTLPEALDLIARAQSLLDEQGCERVYAVAKLDIRKGPKGRLKGKIQSVEGRIGTLSHGS